jgi:hypothetical protein
MRTNEAEVEQRDLSYMVVPGVDEVIAGILRQAHQIDEMWNSRGARVATAQDAQDFATIPRGKGKVFNQGSDPYSGLPW